jgi:hypothetical protein
MERSRINPEHPDFYRIKTIHDSGLGGRKMIARDVEIVDICPAHWRNLHTLVDVTWINGNRPANPKMLSIIHREGKILHTYVPVGMKLPELQQIDNPQELAKSLSYQLPDVERVQILEVQSLRLFSDRIQKVEWRQSMDWEDFLLQAFHQADLDPAGISIYPPFSWAWNGIPVDKIREWFAKAPSPSAYFFGVIRDSLPWTSLILRVESGKVRLITTMDHLAKYDLPADKFPSRPQDLKTICDAITAHVAPVRAALICEYFIMAKLLSSRDKKNVLADAINASDPSTTTAVSAIGFLE